MQFEVIAECRHIVDDNDLPGITLRHRDMHPGQFILVDLHTPQCRRRLAIELVGGEAPARHDLHKRLALRVPAALHVLIGIVNRGAGHPAIDVDNELEDETVRIDVAIERIIDDGQIESTPEHPL